MKLLEKHIRDAEHKWLNKLYSHCKSLFNETNIPSHDHTHHLRVWEYAKDILQSINKTYEIDSDLVEACLISSLFHDTGLTKTLNEYHGLESKTICIQYFEQNKIDKPDNFSNILYAIEKHDDKNYNKSNQKADSLLSIICNADDLDAFGKIGIVRYTEIYLLRGLQLDELQNAVITNLDKRFTNFKRIYNNFTELFEKHQQRYLTTRTFFEDLSKEL